MSEEKLPPKFRHIAVNGKNAKTGTKYARDLSKAMNTLVEADYAVQIQEHKNFTLVLGIHTGERPQPREHAGESHDDDVGGFSPATRELMNRFARLMGPSGPEGFAHEVKQQASSLVRGFNAEQLTTAASELEAALKRHEKHHKEDCSEARAMRIVAEALRVTARIQLQ